MEFSYLNRDLSWLYFNHRVLEEAKDTSLPVYERLKFLAIYSNNLEEFYRVRVSYYRTLLRDFPTDHPKVQRVNPQKVIHDINKLVGKFQLEFIDVFEKKILPELAENKIIIYDINTEFSEKQEDYIKDYFKSEVLPNIQPITLVKKRVKPFLKTGQIYIVLQMHIKNARGEKHKLFRPHYGLIMLPTNKSISRFVQIPNDSAGNDCIMFLENVLMKHISAVFPGYVIDQWYCVKMTRDADLDMEDLENDDLIDTIASISNRRQLGKPNRFEYDVTMSQKLLDYVFESFDLHPEDLVKAGTYHNFNDFFAFPNPKAPELEIQRHVPMMHPVLQQTKSLIKHFERNEVMLHFPYQSYSYFIKYLTEAAYDENVTEIKATQYRVASNSAVVRALMLAAKNGKKVTVFVELKARFDEEHNLHLAKEMKRAGIKIIYSLPGLKVHAKIAYVSRLTSKGNIKKSAFLATGNFNEKTAELYCDHGFFTADPELLEEVDALFDIISRNIKSYNFKHILVPNYNMVSKFEELIESEIRAAQRGEKAYMILKMNSLDDPYMIDKLYEASLAGVTIDLIVRGACCLKPNQIFSKNIRVIRIIDRFLEHARVFYFFNGGDEKLYLGSADWMKRNLYRRIECVFPIYNSDIKQEVIDILNIQLNDNVKASYIDENMTNVRIPTVGKAIQSQQEIYEYLEKKYFMNF